MILNLNQPKQTQVQPLQAYWLQGENPYLNLSIEDWLFRTQLQAPLLVLWRNAPCVVIGRGQNPWQEANLSYLEQHHILLVRRQTGGGTVYHDLGNLNISLSLPQGELDRKILISILLNAFKELGIRDLESNDRGDIKIQEKKIVGSAYRVTQKATLHHVSLLWNADLTHLQQSLTVNRAIIGRSVASVRSEVTTLKHLYPRLELEDITRAINKAFFEHFAQNPSELTPLDTQILHEQEPSIQNTFSEYQSWNWRFGKTPPFQEVIKDTQGQQALTVTVEKGCIQSIEADPPLTRAAQYEWEERYGRPYAGLI